MSEWKEFLITGDDFEWEEEVIPNGRLIRYRRRQLEPPTHEEIKEGINNILKVSYNLVHDLEVLNGTLERHKRL